MRKLQRKGNGYLPDVLRQCQVCRTVPALADLCGDAGSAVPYTHHCGPRVWSAQAPLLVSVLFQGESAIHASGQNVFLLAVTRTAACIGYVNTGVEACFLVFIWQIVSLASEMMGVGNGRRSMKSPPLLLAALVACVIVLGFNYWIASSRSVDLQVWLVCLFV